MPRKLIIPNKSLTPGREKRDAKSVQADLPYRTDMETIERWANNIDFPTLPSPQYIFGATGLHNVAANTGDAPNDFTWSDSQTIPVPGGVGLAGTSTGFMFGYPGIYAYNPQIFFPSGVPAGCDRLEVLGSSPTLRVYSYQLVIAGLRFAAGISEVANGPTAFVHITKAMAATFPSIGWEVDNFGTTSVTYELALSVIRVSDEVG